MQMLGGWLLLLSGIALLITYFMLAKKLIKEGKQVNQEVLFIPFSIFMLGGILVILS